MACADCREEVRLLQRRIMARVLRDNQRRLVEGTYDTCWNVAGEMLQAIDPPDPRP